MPVAHAEERHLQVAHGAQFIGEQSVHGKAHDHASDGRCVDDFVLHQQVGALVHGHDQHLQATAPGPTQCLGIREDLTPQEPRQGADHHRAVQAQHQHFAGTDAAAVTLQHIQDRRRVALGHRAYEWAVGGQPVEAVLQAPAPQVQEAFEHLAAGFQLGAGLVLHGAAGGGLHRKVGRGDHHQQQQRQYAGNAGLERMAPRHRRALWQRSSVSATTSICHVHSLRQLTWRQKIPVHCRYLC